MILSLNSQHPMLGPSIHVPILPISCSCVSWVRLSPFTSSACVCARRLRLRGCGGRSGCGWRGLPWCCRGRVMPSRYVCLPEEEERSCGFDERLSQLASPLPSPRISPILHTPTHLLAGAQPVRLSGSFTARLDPLGRSAAPAGTPSRSISRSRSRSGSEDTCAAG